MSEPCLLNLDIQKIFRYYVVDVYLFEKPSAKEALEAEAYFHPLLLILHDSQSNWC